VSTSPVIRHARRTRAFNLAAVSFSAASALLQVLAFHQVTFWVPVLLVFAAVNVSCAAAGTRNLRRLQARARRPDYAVIARLERGIWGQAFEHAGAVVQVQSRYGTGGVIRFPDIPPPMRLPSAAMMQAMTRIGPAGPVRPCCGTTPGTGHRGTCPRSVMNGGTLTGAAHFSTALPAEIERQIISVHGISSAHLARICTECRRNPALAQGLCGPCYRLALYAGRLPGRR